MLNPKNVVAIGASDVEDSVGRFVLENLLLGKGQRHIFAVNPTRPTVMGLKCYSKITDVPEHVDLAIVATPAKTVPAIIEECSAAGVEGATVLSAGFRETGAEGKRLENEIKRIQPKRGIRILGPNCLGLIRPHINLNASFLKENPNSGEIGFISQSGALGSAILDWAISNGIGFSMFASLGSTVDVDYGDMIDFLGQDPYTRSIIVYMEDVHNARKFMGAARGFAKNKPRRCEGRFITHRSARRGLSSLRCSVQKSGSCQGG
jgi:acetyltransferase